MMTSEKYPCSYAYEMSGFEEIGEVTLLFPEIIFIGNLSLVARYDRNQPIFKAKTDKIQKLACKLPIRILLIL
jgi:hypothetical protein